MTIAEHNADMKRYIGAITENFQHGLSAVAEQLIGMNDKIEVINGRLDKIEVILDSHTEMIGQLMEGQETIKAELKRKVDYDEFIQLERRVMTLEQKTR